MRKISLSPLFLGLFLAMPAAAQTPAPPAGATDGAASGSSPAAATPPPALPPAPAAPLAPVVPVEAPAPASRPLVVEQPLPFTARGPLSPLGSSKPSADDEFKFDYHGYFRAGLRTGINNRPNPIAGQSSSTLHEPLLIDNQYLNWTYTRSQEKSWGEMFFSYGNSHVTGTVSVQSYNFDDWEHYPDAQSGIGQGWLTIRPDPGIDNARFEWKVGSFWEKFGQAGKYDGGPYDTYLFGRTHQMGESLSAEYDVADGDITLKAEHGFGAHGEGSPYQGTAFSFVHHAHVGFTYQKSLTFNLHWLNAFEKDGNPGNPDGSLTIMGPEVRYNGGFLGELYVGFSYVKATNATEIGPVIEVVHAQGGGGCFGIDLVSNYFSLDNNADKATCAASSGGYIPGATPAGNRQSHGNGSLSNLEFNYEYSFGSLWRELAHPGIGFMGDGTDIKLALYGLFTKVASDVPDITNAMGVVQKGTDGVKKLKIGADLAINILPWLAVGTRVDRVQPNMDEDAIAFAVVSPRIQFRTGWNSHEIISIVYSRYMYGSDIAYSQGGPIKWGTPGFNGPHASFGGGAGFSPFWGTSPTTSQPDHDAVTIKATMWW